MLTKFKWHSPLILSLITVGLFSGSYLLTTSQATSAHADQQIKSDQKLTSQPQKRNVTFTGTVPLYTKPAFKKGAQEVVSKVALKALAKSDSSADNFVAYRQVTTNHNQVYYKIASFSGQYRGWIYGGHHAGKFAGGLEPFKTFKTIPLPSNLTKYTFNIAAPGLSNDGKSVTYTAPMNTVDGAEQTVGDAVAYRQTPLKVDQMGTRTREGDTWVHVTSTDPSASKINGWILYKGLSQAESPISSTAVRIDLVNSSGQLVKTIDYQKDGVKAGQTLGSSYSNDGTLVWLLGASDQQKIQDAVRDALKDTNYSLEALSTSQTGYLAEATFGGKTSLTVQPADPVPNNAIQINIVNPADAVIGSFNYTKAGAATGQALGSDSQLSADDQSAILDNAKTALKSSGYSLKSLSPSQINQLAATTFGSRVYLKTTTKTDTIANNAVRINFVDPATKKTVTSIDYTNTDSDDPAPKGSDLGIQSGDQWSLKAEDKTAITGQANAALDGTGYELANHSLNDSAITTLGAAKFGQAVNLDVTATDGNHQTTTNQ
ncbi:hypothetical protein ACFQ22_03550 [Lentilactobacillus raoultii]|uniref:Surface layer protein SlpB n=1 Tax=Lentilactobacillus raoultii TaxID=1987503 RepID=A0ABW3PKP2_9LACO|nr:hypothetical protein [Lentilactobacillus raoultii]